MVTVRGLHVNGTLLTDYRPNHPVALHIHARLHSRLFVVCRPLDAVTQESLSQQVSKQYADDGHGFLPGSRVGLIHCEECTWQSVRLK